MAVAERPHTDAPIERRLSPISFETLDPQACTEWLHRLEYVDIPRRGPREHARLRNDAGVCVVYSSGLVICIGGPAR